MGDDARRGSGEGSELTPLWEIPFPHSLGLLYSAFTYYTGFKVNSGEYKVMGLAPYGEPKYVQAIYDNLIDLKPDGTFRLNMDYFNYCTGLTMTNARFDAAVRRAAARARDAADAARDGPGRVDPGGHRGGDAPPGAARCTARPAADNLCLAGGVALNCVGNGRILREGPFRELWIQPAAGDAGGAVGAALLGLASPGGPRRARPAGPTTRCSGAYLGPRFGNDEIERYLETQDAPYERLSDADAARSASPTSWPPGRSSAGSRGGWSSGRARSAAAASSATPRSRRCSR